MLLFSQLTDAPVVVRALGHEFDVRQQREQYARFVASFLWITYRRAFPNIGLIININFLMIFRLRIIHLFIIVVRV